MLIVLALFICTVNKYMAATFVKKKKKFTLISTILVYSYRRCIKLDPIGIVKIKALTHCVELHIDINFKRLLVEIGLFPYLPTTLDYAREATLFSV